MRNTSTDGGEQLLGAVWDCGIDGVETDLLSLSGAPRRRCCCCCSPRRRERPLRRMAGGIRKRRRTERREKTETKTQNGRQLCPPHTVSSSARRSSWTLGPRSFPRRSIRRHSGRRVAPADGDERGRAAGTRPEFQISPNVTATSLSRQQTSETSRNKRVRGADMRRRRRRRLN